LHQIDNHARRKKYPFGYFKSLWMFLGFIIMSGVGIPLSIIYKNMSIIGIGLAVGILAGMLIGESIEKKYAAKNRLRPMNEKEIQNKKTQIKILMIVGLLGFIALLYFQLT